MANKSFSSGTSLLRAGLPTVLAIALVIRAHAAESVNLSVGARDANAPVSASATPSTLLIAAPQPSRVPNPLRQGKALTPQSVSALAISPNGRQIAVTTLAFRHDRNFWVLADDGQVLWGRYLEPWAPAQVAFVPQGKRFAVGLAYSRFTDPHPTFALFDGETDAPIYGSEDAWELAWMRYGSGDWRTGWMASPLADMLTASAGLALSAATGNFARVWRRRRRTGPRHIARAGIVRGPPGTGRQPGVVRPDELVRAWAGRLRLAAGRRGCSAGVRVRDSAATVVDVLAVS